MKDIDAGSQVVCEDGARGICEAVQDWTPWGGNEVAYVDFGESGKHWVGLGALRPAEPGEVPL